MNKNEQTIGVGLGADSTKIERDFWGRRLFFAAWAFEILAAAIGAIIAWAQTVDAANSGNVNTVDLWLAPLPFVMVAAVELLKIPFAYLVYINRHTMTRVVFSFCLLAISFLTFETLINGLERQFNSITLKVDVPRMELQNSKFEIQQSEKRMRKLRLLSMDDIYTEERKRLDGAGSDYRNASNSLNIEIDTHVDEASNIKSIERKISTILREVSQIEINRESDLDAINKKYKETQKNIDKANKQTRLLIKDAQNERDIVREDIRQKELKVHIFAFELKEEIQKLKTQKKVLNQKINRLSLKIENTPIKALEGFENERKVIIDMSEGKISTLRKNKSKLEANIEKTRINTKPKKVYLIRKDKIEKENNRRLLEITEWKTKEIEDFKGREDLISIEKSNIDTLNQHVGNLNLDIHKQVSNSQVYRIAYLWYNKKTAVDVTKEEAATIAAVWFGSVAGVVATMGVFLAFGSFILRHPDDKFRDKAPRGGFVRRFFVLTTRALRKRLFKPKKIKVIVEKEVPKEVVKEIPVEKVVTQVVEKVKIVEKEVPVDKIVEVIKTRIVHVPIYTNNPDLINKSDKDPEE
jgi:hypothetical protein